MGGILVDILIASIIVSVSYIGYKKGLTSVLYKIIAFILSIIIVFILYKPVSNTIIENTSLDENIASTIKEVLPEELFLEGNKAEDDNSQISEGIIYLINGFIAEAVAKAEHDTVNYVSVQLSYFLIRVITIVILYIVSRILLIVLKFATNIIASLPIISTVNKSGGLIYGVLKSFIIIYAILAVLSAFSPIISSWGIISAIESSWIGKAMYNNNIILNLIIK